MIASDASASLISPSEIAPAAACIIFTATSLVDNLFKDSLRAYTEPLESALIISLSSLIFLSSIC